MKKTIALLFIAFNLTSNLHSVTVSEDFSADTYKDAAGTNADWNTSAGILKLPRYTSSIFDGDSSTITLATSAEFGWRFFVKEPGEIISLGRYFANQGIANSVVHIWSDEGVCLATATVPDTAGWSWSDIAPVAVSTGVYYRVSVVCSERAAVFNIEIPFENAYVKLTSACYSGGATGFPSSCGGVLSGTPDFQFRTFYRTYAQGRSKGYDTGGNYAKYLSYSASETLNSGTINYSFSFSADNSNWSQWQSDITDIDSNKYVRWRIELISADFLKTPVVSSITIINNSFPEKPVLREPSDEFYVNYTTPVFCWSEVFDPDSAEVTYDFQASRSAEFLSPEIAVVAMSTTAVVVTGLSHGVWRWRVSPRDEYGSDVWSDYFTLNMDTIPPVKINTLNTNPASINGAVKLMWVSPADYTFNKISDYTVYFASFNFAGKNADLNSVKGPFPPQPPGNYETLVVSGLAYGATYYFAVNAADFAGNVSEISDTASFLTNAPPFVTVIAPSGGEMLSRDILVKWVVSDSNEEDVFHDIKIYLSAVSGADYKLLNEIQGTNVKEWKWNTASSANGGSFRIRVTATDYRGLVGSGESAGDFSIDNNNSAPEVSIIKPCAGSVEKGLSDIEWSYGDPDVYDRVYFNIYISSDSGAHFFSPPVREKLYFGKNLHKGTTGYVFNTASFPDGGGFCVKVTATDGLLSSATVSGSFKIWNTNHRPLEFSLLTPSDGEIITTLTPSFAWQSNGDPDISSGDALKYHFYLYSSVNPEAPMYEMPGISTNSYVLENSLILTDFSTYFWRIEASDSRGETRVSGETFSFCVKWTEITFDKGNLKVYSADMPSTVYLEASEGGDYAPAAIADADAASSPIMKIPGGKIYKVELKNSLTGATVDSSAGIFRLKFSYKDAAYLSPSTIRAARLGPQNKWEVLDTAVLDDEKKEITVYVRGLSYFRLLNYAAPTAVISEVKNYPNPFNPVREETEIEYVLTEDARVVFEIFTQAGDSVRRFSRGPGEAGGSGSPTGTTNIVNWDGKQSSGRAVSNGVYILRVTASPVSGGEYERIRLIGVLK